MGVTRALCYAAAVALAVAAAPVHAADTGDDYLELCTSPDRVKVLSCIMLTHGFHGGFLAGVVYSQARRNEPIRNLYFCLPAGIEIEQIRDVLVAWLRRNPKERHLPMGLVYPYAMADTFPCPKTK